MFFNILVFGKHRITITFYLLLFLNVCRKHGVAQLAQEEKSDKSGQLPTLLSQSGGNRWILWQ
jgi:hypothetical protein